MSDKNLSDKYYRTFNFEKIYEFGWRAASVQHDFLGTRFRIIFVPIELNRKALDNFENMIDYLKTCRNCEFVPQYYDVRYPLCFVCDFLN